MTVDKEYTQQLEALAEAALTPAPMTRRLAVPGTGQVVSLDDPSDVLGRQYHELKTLTEGIRSVQRSMADELIARADREAKWTYRGNGVELTMDGPRTDFPDAEGLWRDLGSLAADGVISREAVQAAVEPVTTFKVKRAGVNALRKLGGAVTGVLERHEQPSTKPRQVRAVVK